MLSEKQRSYFSERCLNFDSAPQLKGGGLPGSLIQLVHGPSTKATYKYVIHCFTLSFCVSYSTTICADWQGFWVLGRTESPGYWLFSVPAWRSSAVFHCLSKQCNQWWCSIVSELEDINDKRYGRCKISSYVARCINFPFFFPSLYSFAQCL